MIKKFIFFLFLSVALDAGLFDFYYLKKFENAYKNKNFESALQALNHLKNTAQVNFNKANVYYKMGDFDDAIKYYKRAYGKGVSEYQRLFNLGNAYFRAKKIKEAVIAYKASLRAKKTLNALNNLKIALNYKPKQKNFSKKKTKHQKNSSKKDNKPQKMSKKELKELKNLLMKKELKRFLKDSITFKKVPVIFYKIEDGPKINLKQW